MDGRIQTAIQRFVWKAVETVRASMRLALVLVPDTTEAANVTTVPKDLQGPRARVPSALNPVRTAIALFLAHAIVLLAGMVSTVPSECSVMIQPTLVHMH